jgi:hypothetical protein
MSLHGASMIGRSPAALGRKGTSERAPATLPTGAWLQRSESPSSWHGGAFKRLATQAQQQARLAHHNGLQITRRSAVVDDAAGSAAATPGCFALLIGPHSPSFPCGADHWDAAATTCLFLAAARPTAHGHWHRAPILVLASHASSTLTERPKYLHPGNGLWRVVQCPP